MFGKSQEQILESSFEPNMNKFIVVLQWYNGCTLDKVDFISIQIAHPHICELFRFVNC